MSDAALAGFDMLARIDGALAQHALPLPSGDDLPDRWSGLGFEVGGVRYVSPEGQVSEILQPPPITALPGVKDWVCGIANVRGRLLSVIDLAAFFDVDKSTDRDDWRVLIATRDDFEIGLLVEQSHGMQHFTPDFEQASDAPATARLGPFLGRSFRSGGRPWRVLDLHALVQDPQFFDVAA